MIVQLKFGEFREEIFIESMINIINDREGGYDKITLPPPHPQQKKGEAIVNHAVNKLEYIH